MRELRLLQTEPILSEFHFKLAWQRMTERKQFHVLQNISPEMNKALANKKRLIQNKFVTQKKEKRFKTKIK